MSPKPYRQIVDVVFPGKIRQVRQPHQKSTSKYCVKVDRPRPFSVTDLLVSDPVNNIGQWVSQRQVRQPHQKSTGKYCVKVDRPDPFLSLTCLHRTLSTTSDSGSVKLISKTRVIRMSQIETFVDDCVRTQLPTMTPDEAFVST